MPTQKTAIPEYRPENRYLLQGAGHRHGSDRAGAEASGSLLLLQPQDLSDLLVSWERQGEGWQPNRPRYYWVCGFVSDSTVDLAEIKEVRTGAQAANCKVSSRYSEEILWYMVQIFDRIGGFYEGR